MWQHVRLTKADLLVKYTLHVAGTKNNPETMFAGATGKVLSNILIVNVKVVVFCVSVHSDGYRCFNGLLNHFMFVMDGMIV